MTDFILFKLRCVHLSNSDGRCQTESLCFRLRTSYPSLELTQSGMSMSRGGSKNSLSIRAFSMSRCGTKTQALGNGRAAPRYWRRFILLFQCHTTTRSTLNSRKPTTSPSNGNFLEISLALSNLCMAFVLAFIPRPLLICSFIEACAPSICT